MGCEDDDGLDFPAPDRPCPDDVSDPRLIHAFTAPAIEAEGDRAFIVVPTPPPVTSDSVWHYTDISGAVGILDQGCLWATSLLLLNDRQEMLYGVELLQSLRPAIESSESFQPMQRRFILEVIEMTEVYLFNNHLFV